MNNQTPGDAEPDIQQTRDAVGQRSATRGSTVERESSTVRFASDTKVASAVGRSLTSLGDYEILEVIGSGAMGVVYRARQRRLNRIVALKTILSGGLASEAEVKRFRLEAEAAARLDHPGIVPVYEIDEHEGIVFFSMGYIDGESLHDRLQRNTLAPEDAARLVRDLADAIAYAHQAGVVHRDLKPGNVLLDRQGVPRISDFGLAKLSDGDRLTMTGAVMGTPSYMAPEQAAGDSDNVGPRSDVYALGAILYACLSGSSPFRAESAAATMHLVLHATPPPLRHVREGIPRDLETICEKCLEKASANRYASAELLRDELQRYLDGQPILARPLSPWSRLLRWRQRNPLIAFLLAAVLLTMLGGTLISSYFAVLAQRRAVAAERGRRDATEQARLALKSIQTIVHTFQDRLKEVPEAREVRRQLLLDVLGDLEQVASGYLEQSAVDRESARVLADLGLLFSEVGDEGGQNSVLLMDRHFRRSLEIYRQLLAQSPEDDDLRYAVIEVARNYGDISREYRRFQEATEAHQLARRAALEWCRRAPEDAHARRACIETTEALGEALIRQPGRREEGRPYCLEALRLAVEFAEEYPSIQSSELLSLCYCTAGDMYRAAGDLDRAAEAYEKMCRLTQHLTALDPDNPERILDQSADVERLGDLCLQRGQFAQARAHFEACVRLSVEYAELDPDNLYRWQQATWGYRKLAQACEALGDSERAAWAQAKLDELNARLGGN